MTSSNVNEMTTAAGGTKGEVTDPCLKDDQIWQEIQQRATTCQKCLESHKGQEKDCIEKVPGKPCWEVDARPITTEHPHPEWVLMGADSGPTGSFVLFAARRISGIECKWLWENQDKIPDYWELAWQEATDKTYSTLLEKNIGLAMNAFVDSDPKKHCRRHDQLHIHICKIDESDQKQKVRSLRDQLFDADQKGLITPYPKDMGKKTIELEGHDDKGNPKKGAYRVLTLHSPDPVHPFRYKYDGNEGNLFHLLRYNVAEGSTETDKDADMANQSLVVCRRYWKGQPDGFYIVNGCYKMGSCAGTDLLWSSSGCQ